MYKCTRCGIEIEEMTFYPHINILKSNIDPSSVPIDILEDLPNPHLHCYYECKPCHIKYEIYELKLISDQEVDKMLATGYSISIRKTIRYWKDWLNKQEK